LFFAIPSVDYDHRTALHVASMKGDADAAKLLLQYKACPNKIDMHGSSPLLEACKSGNEDVMELLSKHGAKLCMSESQAASVLCQSVFDGDILYLKRLLKAGIDINAADYDKRTASHIAAAEGNVAAIRILAEYGANFSLPDRWGNAAKDEGRRTNSQHLLAFIDGRCSESFEG
jgi:ankyrin repeat protein